MIHKCIVAAIPTGEDDSSFYLGIGDCLSLVEDEVMEYTIIFKYCPLCGKQHANLDN